MSEAEKIQMVDLYGQYLGMRDEIDNAISNVIASSSFIRGDEVKRLEGELADFIGVKHAVTCGTGTDALMLSLMASGLERGDEVIMPAFTFAAVAEVVMLLGGVPVFADVDESTFNIDPESVDRMVSARTKAIVPVHLFGQPCDMVSLTDIAARNNLVLIEDNAQSFGAVCRMPSGHDVFAGAVGNIGCTSFFPSKVLGCFGDGGAVFTDDDKSAELIRALANHGQYKKYTHEYVGVNSRLDTLQAAVLRAKLPHVPLWIESRRAAAKYYTENLMDVPQIKLPTEMPESTHVYHQYTLRVSPESRDGLKDALAAAGIPSMIYYPSALFEHPAYRDKCFRDPMADSCQILTRSVLSLPMHSELTHEQQDRVIESVKFYFSDKD